MSPHPHRPFVASPTGRRTEDVRPVELVEQVEQVEQVTKPWGHEEVLAVLEGRYVAKLLHVRRGGVLSLQLHHAKHETLAVYGGRVRVEHGADAAHLTTVTLVAGQRLHVPARVVHRITAEEDSVLVEASTAETGWRTDVVRFEDRYGRAGTTAP